jgi:invasion protein IalB
MTLQANFRVLALGCLAAVLAILSGPGSATAQEYDGTPYANNGVTGGPDLFETDGFRPVWEQQQQAIARRRAAAAARAKKAAQQRRMAEAKSKAKPQPKQETPAAGPVRTETQTFDQWTVTCRETTGQPKACTGALRVVQPNQQLVILWEIGKGNDGAVRSVMQTPTGVLVQKGVDLQVGEQTVGKLEYVACVPQNCEASGVLDDALAKKLASAGEVTVTIHAKDGRDIHFKFPIKGIDKALAAVRS